MGWASTCSCLRSLGGLNSTSEPGAAGVRGVLCAALNLRACFGTPVHGALGWLDEQGEMALVGWLAWAFARDGLGEQLKLPVLVWWIGRK